MGLFGWGRKKRLRIKDGEPRGNHYCFAHVVLRDFATTDPWRFAATMASPEALNFLSGLWQEVIADLDGEENCLAGESDFKVTPLRMGDWPCVVVELPQAERMAEAIMVAIVPELDLNEHQPRARMSEDAEAPRVHYFTLELGMDLESKQARTVFCKWEGETHSNFGDGPSAEVGDFLNAVAGQLGIE